MDSAEFHAAVYHVVRQIPHQKVTSYGHVAKLIGMPRHSRHVGQALKFVSPNATPPIPWHRVLGSSGTISSRGPGTDGAQRQRDALEAEGVEVVQTTGGEMRVNLRQWGWFPAPGTIDTGVAPVHDAAEEDDEGAGSGSESSLTSLESDNDS